MKINLSELDPATSLIFCAAMQVEISLKEKGTSNEDYLKFCQEIWESMEINDIDELKNILQDKMKSDITHYVRGFSEKNNV